MVVNPESLPSNLSERRFRDYWERTDKTAGNERIRFREVQKLIEGELDLRRGSRPAIGRAIIAQRELGGSTVRHRLAALSWLFLCEKSPTARTKASGGHDRGRIASDPEAHTKTPANSGRAKAAQKLVSEERLGYIRKPPGF